MMTWNVMELQLGKAHDMQLLLLITINTSSTAVN